jgi:hypothetical protein
MTEAEEKAYIAGNRAAWASLLSTCLRELGYDSPESNGAAWAAEREAAIATLRSACSEFGDNDWDESLHLSDVIEKHLMRYMAERLETENDDDRQEPV